MNFLSVENIAKSYGIKALFKEVSFGIEKGQKVALVAKNGSGKTTLLKIVAGLETPDTGEVIFRKGIKVGFLSQENSFDPESTVKEVIYNSDSPVIEAINAYDHCLNNGADAAQMEKALEKMDELKAWDFEITITQILSKLKLDQLPSKVKTFSGGQVKRLALAKLLIDQHDFLILDEPTNHLDLDMIEWLEAHLAQSGLSLFMVTHDRYFLDKVCTDIIELDEGTAYRYKGNYAYYIEKKAERIEQHRSEVKKAQNLYKNELEWMRRMPKARGTKAKSRIDAFYDVKDKAYQKIKEEELALEVNMSRIGGKILELHHVRKNFGEKKILDNFSYTFKTRERLGIVGENGSGKTTFLNLLLGKEEVDGGKIVIGDTIVFGYYTQKGLFLKEDKRVIEVVKDIAEVIPLAKGKKITASQMLDRFLFNREQQYAYVSTLSGGEKKRLYLLTILMANPNFLIMDEPTNDLDILTINILEDFLEDFQGCLIVVSHDRFFMDKLVDHLFVFQGDGVIKDFWGKYVEYRMVLNEKEESPKKEAAPIVTKIETESRKLSYKEKEEYKSLEKEIEVLENRKSEIMNLFEKGDLEADKLSGISNELSELLQKIEEKTNRWLELGELI